ncbi:MAG: divalent metal cation transporter [Planctomycetes bacterium]|nr:divalent metal cation transporter [Planctomycetota bacterium]
MSGEKSFLKALGPGLLFAGAAVGVSHFVQSTRAGADYGFGLLIVVILANIFKYPAFAFGPWYAAATGTSLTDGYRKQGKWALGIVALLTLGTMFTVQAVVTVVTAGIACAVFNISYDAPKIAGVNLAAPVAVSAALMLLSAIILAAGRFKWLDRVNKGLVLILTLCTVIAMALVLPRIDWANAGWAPPIEALGDRLQLTRITGLVGWMPSAFDVAVWHSLWTLARRDSTGHVPSVREARIDFDIGYLGTAILAVCFVALGAGVMFHSGAKFSDNAAHFGAQVVNLFAQNLGEWSRPLLGVCALSVMFSTTLTVVDGFPRAIAKLAHSFRDAEVPNAALAASPRVYWGALGALFLGSMAILVAVPGAQFKWLVDLATTLSFLSAPFFAVLNHRAVFAAWVPAENRPGRRMYWFSWSGIAFSALFALYYIYATFLRA